MTSETIKGNLYVWAFDDLLRIARRRRRVVRILCLAPSLALQIAASAVWSPGQFIPAAPAPILTWVNLAYFGSLAAAFVLADRFAFTLGASRRRDPEWQRTIGTLPQPLLWQFLVSLNWPSTPVGVLLLGPALTLVIAAALVRALQQGPWMTDLDLALPWVQRALRRRWSR
ncbi:hypothetical protein [Amycolatopsis sp. cmx-4-61]|uniref:hypothetical protein n=1 Tax=Amycolatopsis sp. cmx-4-61 TaxID=2790937 RepID=UPI0039792413